MKNLLIYGTLTGNTESVAQQIKKIVEESGKELEIKNINQTSTEDIAAVENLLIVASSTWDDGLPCSDMADFLEENGQDLPDLTAKKLAFFGCGDSNYVQFCKAVDILEETFTNKGGQKICNNLKIDGYIEDNSNQDKIKSFATNLIQSL
jgi:flavodoxin I